MHDRHPALRAAFGLLLACGLLAPLGADAAPTLLEQSRAQLRVVPATEFGAFRPGAWQRAEPEPQGKLGIRKRPSGERGLMGAIWRNALLPGWGQRYLGAPGRGLIFMGAEAATWGTWGSFKWQESLRRDDYIEMAQVFAGVSGDGHADDYWKAVGQHESWLDYNQWLRYQARREYGFGTTDYYSYIAEREIAEGEAWTWDNRDRQLAYLQKRKASNNAERRATYTLYALLVNRVVAVVDGWRLYRSHESIRHDLESDDRAGIGFQALPGEESVILSLGWYRSF
jgi:hypothetical protein